jgi:hypothetical protein
MEAQQGRQPVPRTGGLARVGWPWPWLRGCRWPTTECRTSERGPIALGIHIQRRCVLVGDGRGTDRGLVGLLGWVSCCELSPTACRILCSPAVSGGEAGPCVTTVLISSRTARNARSVRSSCRSESVNSKMTRPGPRASAEMTFWRSSADATVAQHQAGPADPHPR